MIRRLWEGQSVVLQALVQSAHTTIVRKVIFS